MLKYESSPLVYFAIRTKELFEYLSLRDYLILQHF